MLLLVSLLRRFEGLTRLSVVKTLRRADSLDSLERVQSGELLPDPESLWPSCPSDELDGSESVES